MVKLLPFISFEIESGYSPDALLEELSQRCKGKHSTLHSSPEPLVGEVTGNKFKACRAIGYRNSFLPIATGSVKEANGKSHLQVKLRPPIYSFVITAVAILFLLSAALRISYISSTSEMLWPLLVAVGIYAIMQLCFWPEAPKIEAIFRKVCIMPANKSLKDAP